MDKNKEVSKNMKKFGKVSKKKLKQLMVWKKLNMGKIFKKLGFNLMLNGIKVRVFFGKKNRKRALVPS